LPSSSPNWSAAVAGVFEKGKTYSIVTDHYGDQTITVTAIGPHPWLKVKMIGIDGGVGEWWLNASYILLANTEPVAAPTSHPIVRTIDTGAGVIPLDAGSDDVPPDGLRPLGALCHKYMLKRGESWFMCYMEGDEKRICEYRGVHSRADQHNLSEADKLNGGEWTGDCICTADAMRCYVNGKWDIQWSTMGDIWSAELGKKNGVWAQTMNGAYLPTNEWSIPQDSK
jgi:hypothetical protein